MTIHGKDVRYMLSDAQPGDVLAIDRRAAHPYRWPALAALFLVAVSYALGAVTGGWLKVLL